MMNNELRPYELRPVTDIPWIESIPAHWDVQRGKAVYKKLNRPTRSNDEVVTCFRDGVVTLRKNRRTTGFTESIKEIGYQGIRKGDLVIHVMDAFAGAIGVSDSDGKGTPVYSVCESKVDLNNYYYAYVIREMAKTGFIQSLYRGIRERSSDFRFEVFANQYLPIPPLSEQDQIVKYLDHQLAKINKFIKTKKKLIAVLKEQKQAIINEVVTKGIDPNVKMRPSGIEWLGDVPEHWKIIKLKYLTKESFQYGANESGYQYQDNAYRYIRITDISQNGDLKTEGALFLPEAIGANYRLRDGDILFARSGATVGKSFLFKDEYGPSSYAGYLIKFAPDRSKVLPECVYFYTMSSAYSLWLNQVFIQSTIQNVSAEKYKNLVIPLPSLDEQAKLLIYIKEKAEVFDKSIVRILSEIELIQEYKNSLISDVVTGKVDVRNIVIEKLEDEIIEDRELDEDSIDEDVLEAEDGDE